MCTICDSFRDNMAEQSDKKRSDWICFIIVSTLIQFGSIISFFVSYKMTDNIYERVYASTAQLSDFNHCGDSYMFIDTDTVDSRWVRGRPLCMRSRFVVDTSIWLWLIVHRYGNEQFTIVANSLKICYVNLYHLRHCFLYLIFWSCIEGFETFQTWKYLIL